MYNAHVEEFKYRVHLSHLKSNALSEMEYEHDGISMNPQDTPITNSTATTTAKIIPGSSMYYGITPDIVTHLRDKISSMSHPHDTDNSPMSGIGSYDPILGMEVDVSSTGTTNENYVNCDTTIEEEDDVEVDQKVLSTHSMLNSNKSNNRPPVRTSGLGTHPMYKPTPNTDHPLNRTSNEHPGNNDDISEITV